MLLYVLSRERVRRESVRDDKHERRKEEDKRGARRPAERADERLHARTATRTQLGCGGQELGRLLHRGGTRPRDKAGFDRRVAELDETTRHLCT